MKNQHLLLFLLFTFSLNTVGFGQMCLPDGITFETQQEIDDFASSHPGCMEIEGDLTVLEASPGTILDLKGLSQLTAIYGDLNIGTSWQFGNTALRSLEGLENITFIGGNLTIASNHELESLSPLKNLDSVGVDISVRYCFSLPSLEGLENLEIANRNLFIENNTLITSLKGLDNIRFVGKILSVKNNESLLSLEGLEKLRKVVQATFIIDNKDLKSLESLTNLNYPGSLGIHGNDDLFTLKGLENLDTIGNGAELSSTNFLQIVGNARLRSLSTLRSVNHFDVFRIYITDNPWLSACNEPFICNHLFNGDSVVIFDNAAGCNDAIEILESCNKLPKINYQIYFDQNQNGERENEPIYFDAGIRLDPGGTFHYPPGQGNHGGTLSLSEGFYQLWYNQEATPLWELTTDSVSYQLSIDSNSSYLDTFLFGVYPTREFAAFTSYITTSRTRCNELIPFEFHATNLGTIPTDGTLWITMDEQMDLDSVQFINLPDTMVAPYRYGWHFYNLFPGQTLTKKAIFKIPGPPDFPVGDSLNYKTYVDFSGPSGLVQSHIFDHFIKVLCSYDPNDKLVNPARDNNFTLFDEDLIYTIRFQNTGNDFAYDVVIRDTLDENLDASTFKFLSSSHSDHLLTSLEADRYLTFNFKDIFLPDSTFDLKGSQGYLSYMISPKAGLSEKTEIHNTASIYFDRNPPIVTNTTQSIMVSELTAIHQIADLKLHIFPNPVFDRLYIQAPQVLSGQIQLADYTGKLLSWQSFEGNTELNLSLLQTGIYLLTIQTEEESVTEKIVKF